MNEKNIFRKILDKEVPCHKVYEDSNFLVFLDIFPKAPGHLLIIPKTETLWVWDVGDYSGYMELTRVMAIALRKTFNVEMIRMEIYGEQIPYAHVKIWPDLEKDGSEVDFETIAEKIKKHL